jgi:phosphate transport system substrate-binding protein
MAVAEEHGVHFIELPVAYDGISVVVSPENDFVDHLTTEELKKIWQPGSKVESWSDVRKGWPDSPITLYGPGTDSGTFDYFTEAINGKSQACRPDFTASEDDNVLVQGVAGDAGALGFFGYAYYAENTERLKLVPIDGGSGPVTPTPETINDGSYAPLSRPIFIYVSRTAADRPEVEAFVRFYLEQAPQLVAEVGYVALPDELYALASKRLEQRVTGTVFTGDTDGNSLESLFARGL